jgi:hypothetical protein
MQKAVACSRTDLFRVARVAVRVVGGIGRKALRKHLRFGTTAEARQFLGVSRMMFHREWECQSR